MNATRTGVVMYRRCNTKLETLGHVLCKCTVTKYARIAQHKAIIKVIQDHCLQKGIEVATEQAVQDKEGLLKKPDLVLMLHDKVAIVDVTVAFENTTSLSEAAARKVKSYKS